MAAQNGCGLSRHATCRAQQLLQATKAQIDEVQIWHIARWSANERSSFAIHCLTSRRSTTARIKTRWFTWSLLICVTRRRRRCRRGVVVGTLIGLQPRHDCCRIRFVLQLPQPCTPSAVAAAVDQTVHRTRWTDEPIAVGQSVGQFLTSAYATQQRTFDVKRGLASGRRSMRRIRGSFGVGSRPPMDCASCWCCWRECDGPVGCRRNAHGRSGSRCWKRTKASGIVWPLARVFVCAEKVTVVQTLSVLSAVRLHGPVLVQRVCRSSAYDNRFYLVFFTVFFSEIGLRPFDELGFCSVS